MMDLVKQKFVRAIYADHNDSYMVEQTLKGLLASVPDGALMINIGAGKTKLHPTMKNLEIEAGPGVDYVGTALALPFADSSVDLIVTQEVLEHVSDPFLAMREIHRVLKVGGRAYVQLPFMIGFHPCPTDFWRFTDQGMMELARQAGFAIPEVWQSVGPAVGFYRILVEFSAILFSRPFARLYRPLKGVFALLFFPIKWLDPLLRGHAESGRIPGGFFITVQK
jgi:SAM-dependent methyltransferase